MYLLSTGKFSNMLSGRRRSDQRVNAYRDQDSKEVQLTGVTMKNRCSADSRPGKKNLVAKLCRLGLTLPVEWTQLRTQRVQTFLWGEKYISIRRKSIKRGGVVARSHHQAMRVNTKAKKIRKHEWKSLRGPDETISCQ
jgi:hypothetical protein